MKRCEQIINSNYKDYFGILLDWKIRNISNHLQSKSIYIKYENNRLTSTRFIWESRKEVGRLLPLQTRLLFKRKRLNSPPLDGSTTYTFPLGYRGRYSSSTIYSGWSTGSRVEKCMNNDDLFYDSRYLIGDWEKRVLHFPPNWVIPKKYDHLILWRMREFDFHLVPNCDRGNYSVFAALFQAVGWLEWMNQTESCVFTYGLKIPGHTRATFF